MSKTKDRIRESNLRYKQSLGQNFLYDENLLAELAAEAGVTKDEDVLEIGPGCGSLTRHLCDAANRVLAVELDERLIPLLQAFLDEKKNLTVVQGDVMALNLGEVTKDLKKPFAVVANIPYYITTPLIKLLLTGGLPVSRLALMVQQEVADKILASPGEEGWGPLSILCQVLCEPRLAVRVPAENYDRFLSAVGNTCHVVNLNKTTEDVGLQYSDTQMRLQTEKTKMERLLTLLGQATEMTDIIQLENAISDCQYQIDSLTSTINRYDSLIGFSTVQIELEQVERLGSAITEEETFWQRLGSNFKEGLEDFGYGVQDLVMWAAYHIVGIVIFILIVILLCKLWKKYVSGKVHLPKRKKNSEEKEEKSE